MKSRLLVALVWFPHGLFTICIICIIHTGATSAYKKTMYEFLIMWIKDSQLCELCGFCGYVYCTTSFSKVLTQYLHMFNFCIQHVRDLRW